MKKIIIMLVACLFFASSYAQEVYNSSGRIKPRKQKKETGFSTDRLIFGGAGGLSFGDVTSIYIAPLVGYKLTDRFAAGVSFGYNYLRAKTPYTNLNNPSVTEYF